MLKVFNNYEQRGNTMSRIRQMQEQKKGRQIRLGGTSNEKSSLMMKSGSKSKGNPGHATK